MVLLVDDEPDSVLVTELWLKSQGFDVTTASEGVQALDVFARHEPDLVVTDFMMPRLSGMELCRRIREMEKDRRTPIIMISAAHAPPADGAGLYDAFITKPVYFDRLLDEIKRLLPPSAWDGSA